MINPEISDRLVRIAGLHELAGQTWKAKAYARAAEVVRASPADLTKTSPESLAGVGKSIGEVIRQLVGTGSCDLLRELEEKHPESVLSLLIVPGIGPKTAWKMFAEQGIRSFDDLCARADRGEVTDAKLLANIAVAVQLQTKKPREVVRARVEKMVEALLLFPGVQQVSPAGSYRRGRSMVGDIDILIASTEPLDARVRALAETFGTVTGAGGTKLSMRLSDPVIGVDWRVVHPGSWGSALCYFTGSKEHNIVLRGIAKSRGLLVNEYGIWRGDEKVGGQRESDLYEILGVPFHTETEREGSALKGTT